MIPHTHNKIPIIAIIPDTINVGNLNTNPVLKNSSNTGMKNTNAITSKRIDTLVKTFPVLSKGFEIETEMTIHAVDKNFLLEEIPVKYRDRPDGSI